MPEPVGNITQPLLSALDQLSSAFFVDSLLKIKCGDCCFLLLSMKILGEGIRSKYNHHILSHFASDTLQYFDSIIPVLSKGLSLDQLWQKVCGRYYLLSR